jgi:hypothetical protein
MPIERRTRLAVVAVAGALALTACSRSTAGTTTPPTALHRPTSTGVLTILSPSNGQVIHGSNVALRLSLQHARIVPATTSHVTPDQGHIHVLMDNQLVSMTFGLNQVIPNIPPGQHVLHVEFVASDHAPFDPRVFKQVVIEVTK